MKYGFIALMIFSLFSSRVHADSLKIGAAAPQISATDHTGHPVDLGAALSTGTAVIFFYPKAMTPGCTKQACSLRDAWAILQQRDVAIFGVSADTARKQSQFRDKHQLPFSLIADTDQTVSRAFGKSRWSRQAYIFKDGRLVWRDLHASTATQAEDILAALDALGAPQE